MIEAPNLTYFFISIILIILGGFGSILLVTKTERNEIPCIPVIISFIAVIIIAVFISQPIQNEYEQQVQLEIESATCEQLPLMYDEYSLFQEKIKSKYLFDCVADKQDLEWLK